MIDSCEQTRTRAREANRQPHNSFGNKLNSDAGLAGLRPRTGRDCQPRGFHDDSGVPERRLPERRLPAKGPGSRTCRNRDRSPADGGSGITWWDVFQHRACRALSAFLGTSGSLALSCTPGLLLSLFLTSPTRDVVGGCRRSGRFRDVHRSRPRLRLVGAASIRCRSRCIGGPLLSEHSQWMDGRGAGDL